MSDIDNVVELIGASNALRDWFKTQEIIPSDGMLVMEYFIARMIVENGKGPLDLEEKFALIEQTVRSFVFLIQKGA